MCLSWVLGCVCVVLGSGPHEPQLCSGSPLAPAVNVSFSSNTPALLGVVTEWEPARVSDNRLKSLLFLLHILVSDIMSICVKY